MRLRAPSSRVILSGANTAVFAKSNERKRATNCVFALASCDETPETPGNGGGNGTPGTELTPGGDKTPGDEPVHTHTYGNWTTTTPATCGAAGVETRTCTCGASETQPIAATGEHTYGYWTTTTPATCGAAGVETRTCTCGASETQPIAATGAHSYNTNNICAACSAPMQYTEGLAYTLNSDGESYSVSKGTATAADIVIPYYYEGKPVTSIDESAFQSCTGLTTITIPASVTSIGYYAFYGCDSLVTVTCDATGGWWVSTDSTAISGVTADLTVENLSGTYVSYYWNRTVTE